MTHKHWWIEDKTNSTHGWVYRCECRAVKEIYVEQHGTRTVTREREMENADAES